MSLRATVLQDKPALGMESLLGAMGGTLNLWIGISFITLIEIIDMIFNVIFRFTLRPKDLTENCNVSQGLEKWHSNQRALETGYNVTEFSIMLGHMRG